MKIKTLLPLTMVLLFISCTKSPAESPVDPPSDKGEVKIVLDGEQAASFQGVAYYFYPDGGETSVQASGTGKEYVGALSEGTYRALFYNTDAQGVSFSGMESAATATVTVQPDASTRAAEEFVVQPGMLFAGSIESLMVGPMNPVNVSAPLSQLTRSLTLTFALSENAGVETLEGSLCGVYPSLLLSTGKPSAESLSASATVRTAFATTVDPSGKSTATIHFLGLLNPAGGAAYQNKLLLHLIGKSGTTQDTEVDLTQALTDIFAVSGEALSFELSTNVEIKVDATPVSLSAQVTGWTVGEGGGEIDYVYPQNKLNNE